MLLISPQVVYDNLKLLEQVDAVTSATYRELAQEVLGDPDVSLSWREAIADRLNRFNHLLEMGAVEKNDSY
ncbi:MAG: hypothetical protein SFW36_21445 [Leptolyngbyaceae cyanobacterium bins.59]|nr:hypothetical protein [Leptolyngbyaceae cyanobacterium bins.59]